MRSLLLALGLLLLPVTLVSQQVAPVLRPGESVRVSSDRVARPWVEGRVLRTMTDSLLVYVSSGPEEGLLLPLSSLREIQRPAPSPDQGPRIRTGATRGAALGGLLGLGLGVVAVAIPAERSPDTTDALLAGYAVGGAISLAALGAGVAWLFTPQQWRTVWSATR